MALLSAVALVACTNSDIGQSCPELLESSGATIDDGRAVTDEVVGQDPRFPCDDLICIATGGVAGYCSKKCRADVTCPSAFECRTVQPIGEFASDQFCAWKTCSNDDDCGDTDEYCCRSVPNSGPLDEVKLCGFRDEDCS
ncbi:MAG: hypothetical protein AAF654_04685 [Myxococcota bacterium]